MLNKYTKYTGGLFFTARFILALSGTAGAEGRDATVLLRIDGANYVLYDQEYPHRSRNMYSIVRGNPLDSFPFTHISTYGFGPAYDSVVSRAPAFAASGGVSAELGDPLLNRFTNSPGYNRDHATVFGSACRLPSVPGFVYSGYRYLDSYSDRFDEIWKKFEDVTDRSMEYYKEGLAKEFIYGYALASGKVEARGNMRKYGSWGTTPFYFSPLYQSGYSTRHDFRVADGRRSFFASAGYDYHTDYFNHFESEKFNDVAVTAGLQRPLNKLINGRVVCDINTAESPSTKFEASVYDSLSTLMVWKAAGGIFNNLHPFAGLQLSFRPMRALTAFAEAGWDYVPAQRAYRYKEYKRTVSYEPLAYETITFHTSLTYADTLFFPITLAAWYDYYERPIWERIEFDDGQPYISQDTLGNAAPWHVGGRASYEISWRMLSAELWGNTSLTPKKTIQRFSLPTVLGADLGCGRRAGGSPYAGMRFEYRSPVVLRYRNDESDKIETFVAPAYTAISSIFHMPFILPFARDHLGSSVWIEAGPVHISKQFLDNPSLANQRIKEHPSGNLIGPAVSVRFDAVIR